MTHRHARLLEARESSANYSVARTGLAGHCSTIPAARLVAWPQSFGCGERALEAKLYAIRNAEDFTGVFLVPLPPLRPFFLTTDQVGDIFFWN